MIYTSDELPAAWRNVQIGDLCDLKNGKAFKPEDWSTKGLPIVRIQNLNNPNASFNHFDGEVRDRFMIESGSLLFAWSGTPGTSFGAHIWRGGQAVLNQHIFRVDFNANLVDKIYFKYAINFRLDELIAKAHGGVGLRHVTKGKFEETIIPLPPLGEQRRIIAKIEELFSELDKGVDNLTTAREQLRAYRQSVLKHAFEGKLTPALTSSASHDPHMPTIPDGERREEQLRVLPDGWAYFRLGTLTKPDRPITYGVIKLGPDVVGGVPTLRSSDVRRLRLDLESVKRISPDIASEYRRTVLTGGEVLITVRGTLGGVSVVPASLAGWNISREVAMIAPNESIKPSYLQYMLASPQLDAWFSARLRGVAYTGINLETLRSAPVIWCPPALQDEIVRMVESKFEAADVMEAEIDTALARLAALQRSILKRTFSGRLVAQDPADEPASALLERIRAAREEDGATKRRNNKNGNKEAA